MFGDYVSIYDFRQSVADKATVPLYYENRIPELQLTNEHLNEDMERLLEAAELDDEQEKKLEREFAREYHLITRDDRLEAVSGDIVEHFTGRGFQGKAMVVCIDKATAVAMYDKVRKHWQRRLEELRKQHRGAPQDERASLEARVRQMAETDMAVIVSQGQNELREMADKGLDIRRHRKRMVEEDLETRFKDPDKPLRLVFVCAMWITGFDVPSCSTLYLDKPMRNHTLMQTIARANRVWRDKVSGLIVDYVGVFRNLERALAIYGVGTAGGKRPVDNKAALLAVLESAIEDTRALCREAPCRETPCRETPCREAPCREQGFELQPIEQAEGFDRVRMMDDAVDALVATEERKKRYLDHAANVGRLYKAVLPDPAAREVQGDCLLIRVLAEKIRALNPATDISEVMDGVEDLLDSSIAAEGYVIREPASAYGEDHLIDLSSIDFEALEERFKRGRKHTEVERLKGAVARRLRKMVRQNRTRMDYLERFQQMIDAYNSGSVNVEEQFRRLRDFAQSLTVEEQRAVGERISEEELTLLDLLTKPGVELTAKERAQVKKTARQLLATLKHEKLVLDWRKRQTARAQVRVTIETLLDEGLPRAYTPELYQAKSDLVYQHVFDSYFGAGQSIYQAVA